MRVVALFIFMKNYFEYLGIKIYLADFKPKHWLLHQNEFWKWVVNYTNLYEVSSLGRVKSVSKTIGITKFKRLKSRILKPHISQVGYRSVGLTHNMKGLTHTIHSMVAKAFIPNPENKRTVNHKDGNKLNNRLYNLEWNTDYENIHHAIDTGLHNQLGENGHTSRLKEFQVLEIREKCKTLPHKVIAKEYGIANSCVSAINIRRIWKHI